MLDPKEIEKMREEVISYYQKESARLEEQAVSTIRLAGQCRAWSESIRYLPAAGVEYVYGVVERAKIEQAENMASLALVNARMVASREQ